MRIPDHFLALGALATAAIAGGCGADDPSRPPSVGPDARYRPPSLGQAAARARPVAGLACRSRSRARFGAHLELFANRHVVIVPAGVGIAPPRRRQGAYVTGGRCRYAAITQEPTGVIEIERGARLTLGDFFAIWGQPLSPERMATFAARADERVLAFVGGRRWEGDPRAIPLARHAQIVLEVRGYVAPHARYGFPPGL
jgi:hypothetical protein